MKRTKITYILILVLCTLLFVVITGSIGIITTMRTAEDSSLKELQLHSENACLEFNSTINSIEQCVDTLSSAAVYHMTDFEQFKTNDKYVENYTKELENLILYSARNTNGALSIYLRFNPEFTDSKSGLFYVWDDKKQDFMV